MSAKATGIVWESYLPRQEKYVLLALADHAKEDGSDVYPSLDRIQWKTGYSETQVRSIIRSLVRKRILLLVQKGGNGPTDTNRYKIDFQALQMLEDFRQWVSKRKGAKTAPFKGTENEPIKGAVSVEKGFGFHQKKGAETEPEPRTRTKNNLERGNSASELPPFRLQAPQNPEKQKPKHQDDRFPEICEAIRASWPKGEGYRCDITAADAAAINRMLANKHDWSAAELAVCIVARFLSEGINPTESVKAWIGAVTDYQSGPRDRFGVPKYYNDNLDRWRREASTILYGPSPEQLKLGDMRRAAAVECEQQQRREFEQRQREEQELISEMDAIGKMPESELAELRTVAEKDMLPYRERMPKAAYQQVLTRAMAKLRINARASA